MIQLNGYNEVSAGGSVLPPGGYIACIVNAYVGTFQDGTEGLSVALEICDGDFKGYFEADLERLKKFAPNARWSDAGTLKLPLIENGKVHWKLKKFLEAVKASNSNLNIVPDAPFDERSLIGKSCGIIVALKENKKTKSDGSHWTNPYISYAVTTDVIKAGNFSIPDVKKYQGNSPVTAPGTDDAFGGTPISADDTPF